MSVQDSKIDAKGGKLTWVTPSMQVVVTIADVAAQIGTDLDEDFTGLS